jgi:hypothetical protein
MPRKQSSPRKKPSRRGCRVHPEAELPFLGRSPWVPRLRLTDFGKGSIASNPVSGQALWILSHGVARESTREKIVALPSSRQGPRRVRPVLSLPASLA